MNTTLAQGGASHNRTIAVIGLGYVGLSLAVSLSRTGAKTIGFDIDPHRIAELKTGFDRRREVEPEEMAAPRSAAARSSSTNRPSIRA